MNAKVQELPVPGKPHSRQNKDTGFPEPLSPGTHALASPRSFPNYLYSVVYKGANTPELIGGIGTIDRNTTLPHPEADTSENATLEAPDIALSKTRSRHSFLGRHHSYKRSTGKDSAISIGQNGAGHEKFGHADGPKERLSDPRVVAGRGTPETEKAFNKPERSSEGDRSSSEDEVLRVKEERDAQGYADGQRKKGLLRKLQLHKV